MDFYKHYEKCNILHERQKVEIYKALETITTKYPNQLCTVHVTIEEEALRESETNEIRIVVHFDLKLLLSDNTRIEINDGMIALGNLCSADSIVKKFDELYSAAKIKVFEGTVIPDKFGYGHLLDDKYVDSILSHLKGKRIKIEVID